MIERISPEEAKRRMDLGWTYVDVRSVPEFEQGHPRGAYNIPLMHMSAGGMTPNADFMAAMRATFAKDAKLILGCKAGGRSLRAAEMLSAEGYASVVDQRAGWSGARDPFGQLIERGWEAAGLPIETEVEQDRSWEALEAKIG